MKQPKLVIEFRPRLQSCQLYYCVNQDFSTQNFSLIVETSSLTFKCEQFQEQYYFDFIKLKPVVLNSLKSDDGRIITCRLQTMISLDNGCESNSVKFVPDVVSENPVQVYCRFCQSDLLKTEIMFKRILPLPSADFSSGELFCHACPNEEFETKNVTDPKLCDLLYGNYFFKINSDVVSESKTVVVRDVLYCQQCRTWLGTKDQVSVKLWNCTVSFSKDSCDYKVSPREDFVSVVKAAVEDSLATCKIIASHKTTILNNTEYLLMWIMDKNLSLLVSCEENGKLVQRNAMKLFYSLERSGSQLLAQWEKDNSSCVLDISETMFNEGLKYLDLTNELFPKMFRQANNMSIGYLGM